MTLDELDELRFELDSDDPNTVTNALWRTDLHLPNHQPLLNNVLQLTEAAPAIATRACSALGKTNNPLAVSRLVSLCGSEVDDLRGWALFSLGSLIEVDSVAVRQALLRGLEESDAERRGEAMLGLARRNDIRALDAIIADLADESVGLLPLRAAGELGDPSISDRLANLAEGWANDEDQHLFATEEALAACEVGRLHTRCWVYDPGEMPCVVVDRSTEIPRRLLHNSDGVEEVDAMDERYWRLLNSGYAEDERDLS